MSEKERLKHYLESLHCMQTELSEKSGLDKQRINEVIKMRRNAGIDTIRKIANMDIADSKKLNLNWLIRGEGSMYMNEKEIEQEKFMSLLQEKEGSYNKSYITKDHYEDLKLELKKAYEEIAFLRKIIEEKL